MTGPGPTLGPNYSPASIGYFEDVPKTDSHDGTAEEGPPKTPEGQIPQGERAEPVELVQEGAVRPPEPGSGAAGVTGRQSWFRAEGPVSGTGLVGEFLAGCVQASLTVAA
ncbi:hypothetical protein FHR36_007865 [Kitasatospora paracochleata]|uniref:Uncharacterized protein n=1 Tax=Kitasatospora paracochleata TaxID=58354 RepID=A0ABT1JB32_9ACTN|nr:hypothetical protein [Kitasatospora paracochleata]